MRRLCLLLIVVACGCSNAVPLDESDFATNRSEPFDAPDFTLVSVDDRTYTLSELRGRWVLINFWANWCAPCLEEMPLLQELADDFRDHLVILGVNMRESEAEVMPFIESYGIRFPILLQPTDAMLLAYNITGLPQTFLVTPQGEIIYRSFGPITPDTIVEQMESNR